MANGEKWLLPDGVNELLPPYARRLELMRRQVLDYYDSCGYLQLSPALIEYTESLLVGVGEDVSLQTFKMTDQLSGRLLGLRADITPQVARIASKMVTAEEHAPLRLCYSEPILHATASHLMASRTLIQTGAEIYGHQGLSSDFEVLQLMVDSIRLFLPAERRFTLGVGHAGIQVGLFEALNLRADIRNKLTSIYHRKAVPELEEFVAQLADDASSNLGKRELECLRKLIHLHGDETVLSEAKQQLSEGPQQVLESIDYLSVVGEKFSAFYPDISIYYDLSDFRGYNYHTGLVFAVYVEGFSEPVAKGGRYDGVGSDFGSARAATGYSMDLMQIMMSEDTSKYDQHKKFIFADQSVPQEQLNSLRKEGFRVVVGLTDNQLNESRQLGCSHKLVSTDGKWVVESING